MKFTIPSLTAAASLLLAAPLFAQTAGVSHPEDLSDPITATTPAPAQHYQKPSPAIPVDNSAPSAPILHERDAAASGPSASDGYQEPPIQTAQIDRRDPSLTVTDDVNSGVV